MLNITYAGQPVFAKVRKGNEMEIRFPVDVNERASALLLVSDAYISRGYMDAYISRGYVKDLQPLQGGDSTQVLVAVSDGTVIGTVSTVPRSKGALPTEKYYGLANLDERSDTVIEIGRLAVANGTGSLRAMAIIGLLAAVQLWGDRNGVKRALATLKPALRRRLAVLGITSELAAGPEMLIPDAIPPEFRGYFFPQLAAQRPVAVFISLDEVRASILGHLSAANGHITICPEIGSSKSCAS